MTALPLSVGPANSSFAKTPKMSDFASFWEVHLKFGLCTASQNEFEGFPDDKNST